METLKKHLVTIITTVLSILVTVLVAYLTIKWSNQSYEQGVLEREIKVKEELVRLIEENVINQTPLEPSRLSRLIEAKSELENIQNNVTPLELIKIAEFNLLQSNYLDSKQKQIYKNLFDSIYIELIPKINFTSDTSSVFYRNPELINELVTNIQSCKVESATKSLNQLISLYNIEFGRLSKQTIRDEVKLTSKMTLVLQIIAVVMAFFAYFYYGLKLRRIVSDKIGHKQSFAIFIFLAILSSLTLMPFMMSIIMK